MYEKKTHRGRVLIVAAVAVLLFGCAYGRGLNYSGADPLSGILSGAGLGQVLGQGTGGISQVPIIGPLVDALFGGVSGYNNGYGYNDPYYGDRYGYNPSYGDRYGYDPNYRDPYYGGGYGNGSPNRYGPNSGYNPEPYNRYPYGYNNGR